MPPLSLVVDAWRLAQDVLPEVRGELDRWWERAGIIPNPQLRRQARASIAHKRFHCEGGSVFALLAPPDRRRAVIRWIVAFQTISDYLDNLCDRAGESPRSRLRRWHHAMLDALTGIDPSAVPADRWGVDDGGYLSDLVGTCVRQARRFPGYGWVLADLWRLTSLYIDLQVLKHGPADQREALLRGWHRGRAAQAPGLRWYEFAAAAGSTLGVFALIALAARDAHDADHRDRVTRAYFPWIGALHILLDYWIDQEEDRLGGDLNFAALYPSQRAARGRLQALMRAALDAVAPLPDGDRHAVIVHGLPALYLADGKALRPPLERQARLLVRAGGWRTRLLHAFCRLRRRRDPQDGQLQQPPAGNAGLTRTDVRVYAGDAGDRPAGAEQEEAAAGDPQPGGERPGLPAGAGSYCGEPRR